MNSATAARDTEIVKLQLKIERLKAVNAELLEGLESTIPWLEGRAPKPGILELKKIIAKAQKEE